MSRLFSILAAEAAAEAEETAAALAEAQAARSVAAIFSRYSVVASEGEDEPPCCVAAGSVSSESRAWLKMEELWEPQGPWAPQERPGSALLGSADEE